MTTEAFEIRLGQKCQATGEVCHPPNEMLLVVRRLTEVTKERDQLRQALDDVCWAKPAKATPATLAIINESTLERAIITSMESVQDEQTSLEEYATEASLVVFDMFEPFLIENTRLREALEVVFHASGNGRTPMHVVTHLARKALEETP